MSLQHVNLASIMRRAQKKREFRVYSQSKGVLDNLLIRLENDSLSNFFPIPLTEDEISFLKTFFILLRKNLSTTNDTVVISYYNVRKIGFKRAKELTLTFNVKLFKGDLLNYYVSWTKEKD